MAKKKERLDLILVQRGYTQSRSKAQALIMAGDVQVNGQSVVKAGTRFGDDIDIVVKQRAQFVSRGGEKLLGAVQTFNYKVEGVVCADVGASTGGFTDCLLQYGARKVYAIDVGYGQLAHSLRIDERVVVMERTNARYVEMLDEQVDLIVMDASFISLKILLPVVKNWLNPTGDVIALIKPQFEAGKSEIGKGGVVRDTQVHQRVIESVVERAETLGLLTHNLVQSPIKGPAGNIEFLAWFTLNSRLSHLDIRLWLEENL
jgi:23S rRNA (cytidine1920-2'-O)/16S rRNA (cytidine1409-2'-O)-methyltransferase